ncbi:MAG: alpha/beta fold hydrolase [Microthrixaceae bacterium]
MPVLPTTATGQGPDIVLLHGVGVGPGAFAALAERLAVDHRVLIMERPGSRDHVVSLAAQAASVAETMVVVGCHGAVVVGVSGGATLALALAIDHPEVVGALVVHEPLIGEHAPALHARFAAAACRAAGSDEEALDVVRAVLGPGTWGRLDAEARSLLATGASWCRAEIPLFAAFAPTADELASLRRFEVLTTVGAESDADRHVVADALRDLAGAVVAVVPGAGNAVQIDAPAAFAAAIRSWRLLVGRRCV